MRRRIPKRERIRRRRVYLALSGVLVAMLVLLVLLEQREPATRAVSPELPVATAEGPADGVPAPEPGHRAESTGPVEREAPQPEPAPSLTPPPSAKVAIIIDDVGYHGDLDALASGIPFPLTFAVLPGLDSSATSAVRLRDAGCEVMLHLPMEPECYPEKNPGPGALFTFMTHDEIRSTIRENIRSVPGVRGVNNHMGSLFTVREDLLKVVFEELRRHDLYFVDSRTTSSTAAQRVARRHGVPSGRRSVFLDNEDDPAAITTQLEQLFQAAASKRSAIGIGHYREKTLLVLATEVPKLCERYPQVSLVHASEVVH